MQNACPLLIVHVSYWPEVQVEKCISNLVFCSEVNSLCSCGKFATPQELLASLKHTMSQTQPSNFPSISAIFSGVFNFAFLSQTWKICDFAAEKYFAGENISIRTRPAQSLQSRIGPFARPTALASFAQNCSGLVADDSTSGLVWSSSHADQSSAHSMNN